MTYIIKIPIILLILLVLILGYLNLVFWGNTDLINLTLHASYSVNPLPNYTTAKHAPNIILTDGKKSSGKFWMNGTSLGWTWLTPVTVVIDLNDEKVVSMVKVQAGAKSIGKAFFPSQIFAYGAGCTGDYEFMGATKVQMDKDNPCYGRSDDFTISFSARVLRKIALVIFARGAFIFLGEIEAFGTNGEKVGARSVVGKLNSLEKLIADGARRRRKAIAALPMPMPMGPSKARRWSMPISRAGSCKGTIDVCRIEPWRESSEKDLAVEKEAPIIALKEGRDYIAFRISNNSEKAFDVHIKEILPANVQINWKALAYVRALNYTWVPDVVVPFKGAKLAPWSSVVVLGEVKPLDAGKKNIALDILCGEKSFHYDLSVLVVRTNGIVPPLHGNLWLYIHEPEHAPVSKALACRSGFLADFGIDTAVVHPDALMPVGGKWPTNLLRRYFKAYRGARRVLLAMDIKGRPWTFKQMEESKAIGFFQSWWVWIKCIAKAANYSGEIILYPIDEPGPDDILLLLKTRDLFRLAGLKAKVYATVENETAKKLLSLDILQIHNPSGLFSNPLKSIELQSYYTKQDGRLQSVHGYYRLQGWRALKLGFEGVGVWSAWDGTGLGDPASGWDPFVGKRERDFGLLYVSPEGCVWPSLRILAWRRGMEENRILRTLERAHPSIRSYIQNHLEFDYSSPGSFRRLLQTIVKRVGSSE